MANPQRQIKPKGGGSGDPAVGYLSIKRMKAGSEFRGSFSRTYKVMEKNDEGKMVEKQTHYFEANESGTFKKVDKEANVTVINYKPGDTVGINGTVQLNDIAGQLEQGTAIVLKKIGSKKNAAGRETQLIEVYHDDTPAAAKPDTSDNDEF